MRQKDLEPYFLSYFQKRYKEGRIYRNNSGMAWRIDRNGKKYPVKFGIPLPQGRGEGGGGPDYIAFIPTDYYDPWDGIGTILITKFYEIKTKNDKISTNQINFANQIIEMGGEYFIVHENHKKFNQQEKDIIYSDEIIIIERWK